MVVKGLPKGVGDHVLIVYMDAISPVRCACVQITGTVAVVEFLDYVGKCWVKILLCIKATC